MTRRARSLTLPALILGGCCLGLLSLYFSAGRYTLHLFVWYLTQPMVLALNLLPYVLLCLLLYGVFNRAWLSFALTGGVCLFFSWAQYWKLVARNDPIYAEDLTLISEAAQMSGQYIQFTWQIILSAILVVAAVVMLARFFPGKLRKASLRAGLCALVIAGCAVLYPTVYSSSGVYNAMTVWPSLNQWFETNRYISRGGIYPFLHSIQSALPTPPEGYDAEEAEAILSAYESDDIPENQKVSVICVMYEAYADLSLYTDAITQADPYEAFHALQAESCSGTLVTNIFAGGTIDTERCVLTGFSALTNFRRPSWSYARYFAGQGYTVNGAHAGYEAFYNRRNVNENLGISDYRFIEGYYEDLFPGIPTDAELLPDIVERCKAQMADGPVFSFNVTYQNHGPYSSVEAQFEEEYIPQGDMSEADWLIANNYLSGVADTGNQMMAMADAFRDSDEPVILLFFGDHKPWLGEQSATYRALGIDIFSQSDDSFYTYYSTEYLIWANDAAKEALNNDFSGTGPTISPCYLMNVLFDQCGWEGSAFTKLSGEVMEVLPIVHGKGRCLVNGQLLNEEDLPEDAAALLNKLRRTQYYLAQDANGIMPN